MTSPLSAPSPHPDSHRLPHALHGKAVIVGVGNRLLGDDGAGPFLVDLLGPSCTANCIDVATAPENHAEKIARMSPESVLIVDALDYDGAAGEWRLIEREEIGPGSLSTHALSLKMFAEYLHHRCGAQVRLLGIKPQSARLGDGLSGPVRAAVRQIAYDIATILATTAGERAA